MFGILFVCISFNEWDFLCVNISQNRYLFVPQFKAWALLISRVSLSPFVKYVLLCFDSHVSSTFHHLTLLPSYSPHIRLNKPHQRSTTKYATSKQPPTKSIPSPNPYPVPPSSAKATPVKLNPLIYPTIVSSLVSEHKPPLSALRESKSIVIT